MKTKILKVCTLVLGSFTILSMAIIKTNTQEPWEAPSEYKNMKNPYADIEDNDRIGRSIYSKHCKYCHGSKGEGDGNQAKLLETPAANFSLNEFKKQTDGSIYYKIYSGRNEMPSFEKIITDDEDLWMLVNYIKKF